MRAKFTHRLWVDHSFYVQITKREAKRLLSENKIVVDEENETEYSTQYDVAEESSEIEQDACECECPWDTNVKCNCETVCVKGVSDE